ncbi:ABC transporter ATP-binding protein [Pseudonocardia ailaonensis]|uniref:ABC transporter ATP-binding protein n=1 Tax=Pseudonocardia ailaonensis TaxID=367279 RepID=A0ABN2MZA3_9PSEU
MRDTVLELTDLQVEYGRVRAVQGLTLQVRRGQIVALLGPNGAGKSSTLRAISGVAPVRAGSIRTGGQDITRASAHEIVKAGIAHVPEGREIFTALTVRENLELGATTRGTTDQLDYVHTLFPRLAERRSQKAGTLSGGEQQMLAVGRALMSKPGILLLDEPSMGLAPIVIRELLARMKEIASEGLSILLVEQNAAVSLPLADHVYVMATGRLRASGEPGEFEDAAVLAATYLG